MDNALMFSSASSTWETPWYVVSWSAKPRWTHGRSKRCRRSVHKSARAHNVHGTAPAVGGVLDATTPGRLDLTAHAPAVAAATTEVTKALDRLHKAISDEEWTRVKADGAK